jgi:polyphosphate kinase
MSAPALASIGDHGVLNTPLLPDGDFLIGSADWMYRNLSKRIEVVTPVLAAGPKQKLWEVLDICLRDQRQAWVLGQGDTYSQLQPEGDSKGPETIGAHQRLMDLTRRRTDCR